MHSPVQYCILKMVIAQYWIKNLQWSSCIFHWVFFTIKFSNYFATNIFCDCLMDVLWLLNCTVADINAVLYHAGLSQKVRKQAHHSFVNDETQVICYLRLYIFTLKHVQMCALMFTVIVHNCSYNVKLAISNKIVFQLNLELRIYCYSPLVIVISYC